LNSEIGKFASFSAAVILVNEQCVARRASREALNTHNQIVLRVVTYAVVDAVSQTENAQYEEVTQEEESFTDWFLEAKLNEAAGICDRSMSRECNFKFEGKKDAMISVENEGMTR
jgi:hypothetical protein